MVCGRGSQRGERIKRKKGEDRMEMETKTETGAETDPECQGFII